MCNRREFLSSLASVVSVGSMPLVIGQTIPQDAFMYHDWSVHWRDWQAPMNQIVLIGFWYAMHTQSHRPPILVSTSAGVIQWCQYDFEAIDLSCARGHRHVLAHDPPEMRDAAKRRSCAELVKLL